MAPKSQKNAATVMSHCERLNRYFFSFDLNAASLHIACFLYHEEVL